MRVERISLVKRCYGSHARTETNAGVSPLRFASVEMTEFRDGRVLVEMTGCADWRLLVEMTSLGMGECRSR